MATNVASMPAGSRRSAIQIAPALTNGHGRAEAILGVPFRPGRHSAEVTVTPGKAQMLLAAMPTQRALNAGRVAGFAADIRAGRWMVTHQGVAFNERGELIDGQHRLSACVEADMPIQIMATFNAPQATMSVVDRGKVRVIADDLVMMGLVSGHAHSQVAQSAAKVVWHIDNDRAPWTNHTSAEGLNRFFNCDDCVATMTRHPLLADTAGWVLMHRKKGVTPPAGPFAAMLTLTREVNDAKAMKFAEQVIDGEGLVKTDPAHMLRESMHRATSAARINTNTKRQAFLFRYVYAWNAFWEGRKLEKLYAISKSGEFPKIAGYRG